MLVLSRKVGETIIITLRDGSTMTIRHLRIDGNRARIGIEAPEDVGIRRGELPPIQGPTDLTPTEAPSYESP